MIFSKSLKIAHDPDYSTSMLPARNAVADWYKRSPLHVPPDNPRTTYKGCLPFLDAMSMGYVLTLPVDLKVSKTGNGHWVEWAYSGKQPPIEIREADMTTGMPVPNGFSKQGFAFYFPTTILAPKGYSTLVTHPFNRHDLPFVVFTGLVDNDVVQLSFGKLPFFIKEDFEGIIPAGTPYAQIVPIKREKFTLKIRKKLIQSSFETLIKSQSVFAGWYKKNVRVAKSYSG